MSCGKQPTQGGLVLKLEVTACQSYGTNKFALARGIF